MVEFINNYFGFNKQQRNGLLVLVIISFILLAIRLAYPYFLHPEEMVIKNLPLIQRGLDSSYEAASHPYRIKEPSFAKFFVFDPNSVNKTQLLSLGFSEKAATTFLKYRDKGFVFRKKEDLKKVYGVSEKRYLQLEPYILINGNPLSSKPGYEKKLRAGAAAAKQTAAKIELNNADSAALVSLNGIGASYAKRIMKYRSMLGGFVSVEQLNEVYGFTPELFEKIKSWVTVDPSQVRKINLNRDDFKTVNKHPYISYELTKSIFDWRRKTTLNATNLKEIINDLPLYQRLLPYLLFE
jgi:competence ComEA-like helix-hairpin-helix protein